MFDFNVGAFFIPSCFPFVDEAQKSENQEYLGDMLRIRTIVPLGDKRTHAGSILNFFNIQLDACRYGTDTWKAVRDLRMWVFSEMLALTGDEYRLDWSRTDGAFCLFFRERDSSLDATRDIDFVTSNTLRVIGLSRIDNSYIHGFGLFSTADIFADETLGILDGQMVALADYDLIRHNLSGSIGNLRNQFFMEWNAMPDGSLLTRSLRTNYSYINHSPNPNLALIHDARHVVVVAARDIRADEELLLDYRRENIPEQCFTMTGSGYLREIDFLDVEPV